jgi:hypothetical protein
MHQAAIPSIPHQPESTLGGSWNGLDNPVAAHPVTIAHYLKNYLSTDRPNKTNDMLSFPSLRRE